MIVLIDRTISGLRRRAKQTFHPRQIAWRVMQMCRPDRAIITRLDQRLKIRIYPTDIIGRDIFVDGVFEAPQCAFVRRFLRPGMVVFDVGANIGQYTLLAAEGVGSHGQVHSFEPDVRMQSELRFNIDLNGFQSRCSVNPVAVSDKAGHAALCRYEPGAEVYSSLRPQPWKDRSVVGHESVETITLDGYVRQQGIERVDLIKMDIEGAERLALIGAHGLLSRDDAPVILLEIADVLTEAFESTGEDVWDLLQFYGYQMYEVRRHGALVKLNACPPRFTGEWNYVAVKDERQLNVPQKL